MSLTKFIISLQMEAKSIFCAISGYAKVLAAE